ncbi:MAG TPA: sigma-70 family RNA polymerase sigma factor [Puia sp.]|nr:sigma-70 family RNA polymerase sigma factor [Puia sp.]
MTRDQQQLVREFIGGSHSAFECLYNQYSAAVYANIRKVVKPADIAEDILQDVFTVLWTNRAKLDPGQSVGNWLFVVSYHRSLSYLKKKLRENTVPAAELLVENIPSEPEMDEKYYGEQINILNSAVDHLPLHKQRVFRLYHYENKTFDEIAQELDLSVGSVRFYLKQSRAFIRQYVSSNFAPTAGISLTILSVYFC